MTAADPIAVADYEAQAREFLRRGQDYLAAGTCTRRPRRVGEQPPVWPRPSLLRRGGKYETHADFSFVLNRASQLTGDDRLRGLRGIANDLHGNYYRRRRHLDATIIGKDLESTAELLELLGPLAHPMRRR